MSKITGVFYVTRSLSSYQLILREDLERHIFYRYVFKFKFFSIIDMFPKAHQMTQISFFETNRNESLIKVLKSRRPEMNPCRTPVVVLAVEVHVSSILSLSVLHIVLHDVLS